MIESDSEYQFIELNRTFHELSKYANEDDELDLSHAFRVGDRLSWSDLIEWYRVIILSEAGSGKTAEIRNIALNLRAQGKSAFFIRLEHIPNDFEDGFEVGTFEEFQSWLASNDEGWLLLDSVDEARLRNPGDFALAVRKLGRRIATAKDRSHIVITGRTNAWRPKTDLALCVTDLPFTPVTTTANEDEASDIDDTVEDAVETSDRPAEKSQPVFKIVTLDDLSRIEFDGTEITLHDPLFLLENPRVAKRFTENLTASIIEGDEFEIDGHKVRWTVTLLPEVLRDKEGEGGRAGKGREEFKDLYIPDNESKVSILRNGREIYYDLVPKLYPGGRDKVDRYIGVEIDFPAALDEYFQVRNVKRGAEPVNKLRETLRKSLAKPIKRARKDIRDHWQDVKTRERQKTGDDHSDVHEAVDEFDQTAPTGRANPETTPEEIDLAIREIVEDMGYEADDPEAVKKEDWLRRSLDSRSATILDGSWPSKEMFDIRHLSGKAVITVNRRHPFFKDLVEPLRALTAAEPDDLDPVETIALLKKLDTGIDLLMIAYARAENMHVDPERAYGNPRNHWGTFAAGLVGEQSRRIS